MKRKPNIAALGLESRPVIAPACERDDLPQTNGILALVGMLARVAAAEHVSIVLPATRRDR